MSLYISQRSEDSVGLYLDTDVFCHPVHEVPRLTSAPFYKLQKITGASPGLPGKVLKHKGNVGDPE